MMMFAFLCMCWNVSLANDENPTLKEIYEGQSEVSLATLLLGATGWGTTSGVQFNQELSFTGKGYFGDSSRFISQYPIYYENSYCTIYGSSEIPQPVPEIKTGSVYRVSSMKERIGLYSYTELLFFLVSGHFVKPHYIFISCRANQIDFQTSVATFEDLLDNVITLKAPKSFKDLIGF